MTGPIISYMSQASRVLHQIHRRKRIYIRNEPFPHPDRTKRIVDTLAYVVGILSPLASLPQLFEVWVNMNVAGTSIFTWIGFFFIAVVMATYGIVHRGKNLIIMYVSLAIIDFLIVIGILVYS